MSFWPDWFRVKNKRKNKRKLNMAIYIVCTMVIGLLTCVLIDLLRHDAKWKRVNEMLKELEHSSLSTVITTLEKMDMLECLGGGCYRFKGPKPKQFEGDMALLAKVIEPWLREDIHTEAVARWLSNECPKKQTAFMSGIGPITKNGMNNALAAANEQKWQGEAAARQKSKITAGLNAYGHKGEKEDATVL